MDLLQWGHSYTFHTEDIRLLFFEWDEAKDLDFATVTPEIYIICNQM